MYEVLSMILKELQSNSFLLASLYVCIRLDLIKNIYMINNSLLIHIHRRINCRSIEAG